MPTSSAYEQPETTLGTFNPPREGREKRDKVQKGIRSPTFQQGPQNGNVDVLVLLGADVKHRYLFAMKPDNTYSQVPTGILHIFRGCLICDIVVYQSKQDDLQNSLVQFVFPLFQLFSGFPAARTSLRWKNVPALCSSCTPSVSGTDGWHHFG